MDTFDGSTNERVIWRSEKLACSLTSKSLQLTDIKLKCTFQKVNDAGVNEVRVSQITDDAAKIVIKKFGQPDYAFALRTINSIPHDMIILNNQKIHFLFDFYRGKSNLEKRSPYPEEHCFVVALNISIDELCKNATSFLNYIYEENYEKIFFKGKGQSIDYDHENLQIIVLDKDRQKLSIEKNIDSLNKHYTFWRDGD